ncbi:MAG TPA: NAD(+) kinase [Halothiobacillaceae bacterium]|nr:NAD(+) kinase [Halothiobacillaceae bacterium]
MSENNKEPTPNAEKAPTFKRVGVMLKPGNDAAVRTVLTELIAVLESHRIDWALDDQNENPLPGSDARWFSRNRLDRDLIVVIGGDGTLLNAARSLCRFNVPIVGVNLGRLGFLADISPPKLADHFGAILDGHFSVDNRFLLEGVLMREDSRVMQSVALNDITFKMQDPARMIEFEMSLNGTLVNHQRSDGVVVCTPTGSTAYALSAGGPLIDPELEAIGIVSICPHTLSYRPIVVDAHQTIEISLKSDSRGGGIISFDGQLNQPTQPGDVLIIRRHDHQVQLLHPPGHDHFSLLRSKLGWSGQQF